MCPVLQSWYVVEIFYRRVPAAHEIAAAAFAAGAAAGAASRRCLYDCREGGLMCVIYFVQLSTMPLCNAHHMPSANEASQPHLP